MNERWTIAELQAAATRGLEGCDIASKRTRSAPDARTIRYYTTLGLLDRPAEMRGRTAFYGRRHLLQLVCIKRLQAEGLSLTEVQQKLAGATNRQLAKRANLAADFWDDPLPAKSSRPTRKAAEAQESVGERERFWAAEPATAPPLAAADQETPRAIPSIRLPVAPGASLEITGVGASQLTAANAAALQPLLRQLGDQLHRLGLLDGSRSAPPLGNPPLSAEQEKER